ncbi:ORF6N domain-containing protein [Xenorhabdus sp. TS4]|uniref:ORF6N domain-containing protein n=1 Tax=Xenorhabdus sp. TS4 TaxID=1873483 RepID=UPI001CA42580|nr:ORF6N domain-containing protein [Xenorhabdus sp. TS4]MBC8951137.1 antirepressor [Xenorhabdus sp. TS4]
MLSIPVNEVCKTSNSVQSMTAIMHNSIPVITTELLANVYETDVINIQVNHSRNKGRFVEGKHFFKVAGQGLKDLRLTLSKSQNLRLTVSQLQISPKARSLVLWTERGAARHAKMLDTDKAWDVFEKLEDFYFNQKEAEAVATKTTVQQRNPLKNAVNLLVSKKGIMYPEAYSLVHQRFNVEHIDELTVEQLPQAIEYIHKMALTGEWLPKEELPSHEPIAIDLSLELNNIGVIYKHLKRMADIWEESISPALELVNSPITSRFHTYLWDASGATYSTKCAIERKVKLLN